ncbi:MAG: hypothetical protein F4Z31_04590 [Gemmatimonadetes bacterium]|nr:hypothetical protein [Gemmatimonadota bacterium]MYA41011.1 hypothetical protein [Gemmatimonadota bacterium]MYE95505.1 hypothetical protein [Gemmatimonadota bacterium]MYJ09100.1 hypothetical protein [Gemmatimonadota bacterium]
MRAIVGVVVLLAVTASPGVGQVIAGPNGPVEFIGLQDWDAQELFDAIQELDPDRPFSACAADMRFALGFAQAGAFRFSTAGSDEWYTVVVGVEDSSGVHYRPTGSETVSVPEPWEDLKAIVREDAGTVSVAARTLHWADITVEGVPRSRRELAELMDADPETVDQVWDLLDRADGEEDRRLAHEVLASDSSWLARSVATLVLGNFIDDDSSWHTLVESLIDPDARVGSVAMSMVDGLGFGKKDPVDWSGARASLSAIFGGSNPYAFRYTLDILVATDVDSEFARQLVRENPDLLLAHVGAQHEMTREPAVDFLRAISGEDFGTDVEAWRAWVSDQPGGGKANRQ